MIADSILIVEIRIDDNQRSNLKSEFDSTTTIRFAIPNRIGFPYAQIFDSLFW